MTAITRAHSFESVILMLDQARDNPQETTRVLNLVQSAMAPLARHSVIQTDFLLKGRALSELASQMDAGQINRFIEALPPIAKSMNHTPAPGMTGMIFRAVQALANARGHRAGVRALLESSTMQWHDDGDPQVHLTLTMP